MGVGVTRVAVLLALLALWGWSSQAQSQVSAPLTPAAVLTGVTTDDDGGDWLPALVPGLTLVATFVVVLVAVVCLSLVRPTGCVRSRATRSRAPPAV